MRGARQGAYSFLGDAEQWALAKGQEARPALGKAGGHLLSSMGVRGWLTRSGDFGGGRIAGPGSFGTQDTSYSPASDRLSSLHLGRGRCVGTGGAGHPAPRQG